MKRMSALLAVLLVALASAAHAADSTDKTAPTKPVTGQGAATTVGTNPAATESGGKADKGLTTAEKNISKPKRHTGKAKGAEEKSEHPARAERPSVPERPGR